MQTFPGYRPWGDPALLVAGWLLFHARGLWRWHVAPPWLQQHFQELAGSQGARGWGDSSHPAQPSLPLSETAARAP